MDDSCLLKSISILLAVIFVFIIALPLPAGSSETPTLKIAQVQLTEDALASGSTASVDVTITGNSDGFLATSFGILYDSALTLTGVTQVNAAGRAHVYANNAALGLIWFSGAASSADAAANLQLEETMFTLEFTLPEGAAVGDSYLISFCWNAADNSQGYWLTKSRTNIIGNLQSVAQNGSITIPDPNAPFLSDTELLVTTGGEANLSVENYSGTITWFSDNTNVATVQNGTVTGISTGTCTVYALFENTLLSCSVTVTEEAYYDISDTPIIYIRDPNKTVILKCPEGTNSSSVNWVSDNISAATVDNGKVTGVQNGAATIYAICGSNVYQAIVIVEFPEPSYDTGDITMDGSVDVLDVIMLNRNLLGVQSLNATQKLAADVHANGAIDSMDSLCIMKYVVGLIEAIPVEA